VVFEGETVFTKQQVTQLFDISEATVERCIARHGDELRANGCTLLRGKKLNEFKDLVDAALINEGAKTSVPWGVAMLLPETGRAKHLRTAQPFGQVRLSTSRPAPCRQVIDSIEFFVNPSVS
jgi:hypothetical protein